MSAKSACGRRFLKLEEAMPMNIVLEILHSLASLASIGRFIFDYGGNISTMRMT